MKYSQRSIYKIFLSLKIEVIYERKCDNSSNNTYW